MKAKAVIFMFFLFISLFIQAQEGYKELPYYELPKYSKEIGSEGIMARMIDELGVKYYWATEGITDNDLYDEFDTPNTSKYLLENLYQLSELMLSYTLKKEVLLINNIESLPLEEIRSKTLFKIKYCSDVVLNKTTPNEVLPWDILNKPLADFLWYCDQLIANRSQSENPYNPRVDHLTSESQYEKFRDSRGADGITNEQWIYISKLPNPMGRQVDIIRAQNRTNNEVEATLKKEAHGIVEAGELEEIKTTPTIVEGRSYVYYGLSPDQLSFLVSSDSKIINGLIQWIIFINAGNSTTLDEVFRFNLYPNENGDLIYFNSGNTRIISDKEGNSVTIKFISKFIDVSNINNYRITQVLTGNVDDANNQIIFIADSDFKNGMDTVNNSIILSIESRSGSLLDRIRMNIENERSDETFYKEELTHLNLKEQ